MGAAGVSIPKGGLRIYSLGLDVICGVAVIWGWIAFLRDVHYIVRRSSPFCLLLAKYWTELLVVMLETCILFIFFGSLDPRSGLGIGQSII